MKKIVATIAACIALCASIHAQQKCGSAAARAALFGYDAAKEAAFAAQQEQRIAAYTQQAGNTAQKTTDLITIPVVFHFVLDSNQYRDLKGIEGINRRVASQLQALNDDFNAANSDLNKVPSVFQPLIGNLNVRFAIAHTDPAGKSTSGIELRVHDEIFGWPLVFSVASANEKYSSKSGFDAWDPQRYMNVWVANITDNIQGYTITIEEAAFAQIPGEAGVTMDIASFGKQTQDDTYFTNGATLGRTMVHEAGHYLGLRHIWGDRDDCSDDDGIGDTPKQDMANTTCPSSFPIANCTNDPGGEMYMNYMDYVNDACMYLFTKGQVARMQAETAPGGTVHGVASHPELTWWPVSVKGIDKTDALSIYPNPAGSVFSLNFAQPTQGLVFVDIVSITGQIAKHIEVPAKTTVYTVDATGLNKGVYLVQCRFEEGTVVTRKIVLQ